MGYEILKKIGEGLSTAYKNYATYKSFDAAYHASKGDTKKAVNDILKANIASSVGSILLLPTPVPMKKRVDSPK